MKMIALEKERPGVTPDQYQPYLKSEAARVWELYQNGYIRESYFHAHKHTAVFVLECGDLQEARALLQTLPLVEAGLITFDLLPLVPYDGFARLFEVIKS